MSAADHLNRRQIDHLWGSNDLEALFPGGRPSSLAPWPGAPRSKVRRDYDKERVHRAIEDRGPVNDVDPRELKATQPAITRAGVAFYLENDDYETTGKTFADRDQVGNKLPFVYSRERVAGGDYDHLLLAGHHRAAAALLRGRPLRALHVEGPWGAPRRQR